MKIPEEKIRTSYQVAVKLKKPLEDSRLFINDVLSGGKEMIFMLNLPNPLVGDYDNTYYFYFCPDKENTEKFIQKIRENDLVESVYLDEIKNC